MSEQSEPASPEQVKPRCVWSAERKALIPKAEWLAIRQAHHDEHLEVEEAVAQHIVRRRD